jgi:parallel beta-helix repeat protein
VKNTLPGFISVLLLAAASLAVFNVKPVGALPFTVYIKADGSIDPPSANITTSDNVTYVFTDHNFCGVQVERDNIVIDGAGYVLRGIEEGSIMDPSENNTLVGLNLMGRNNVTVQNLNIIYVPIGIGLYGALNCTIRRNTINVDGPFMGATCIRMLDCSNITVVDNSILDSYRGIDLDDASENQIVRNRFINDMLGIEMTTTSNNVVTENSFVWTPFSLIIYTVSNDSFCHNNFYHRHYGMGRLDAFWSEVDWNQSYAVGGNYWSDYVGVDLYSGPYQNETGSDGIGDTPQVFAEGAAEMYPLMGPWTAVGEQVTVIDPSGVSVTFSNVTAEGITTIDTAAPPDPPSGMKAVSCCNLRTEASYSGKINVSLPYDNSTMTGEDERLLKLMQWNETSSMWVDITTGIGVRWDGTLMLNAANGETSSLSLFAVMWRLPGDINADFTVDIYDAIILAGAYNSKPGDPNWKPNADINGDNIVDIYDSIILANHYNQHYP